MAALERVSIIEGKTPILVVAPHGAPGDDVNTDIIAEHIASAINAYAVINRGWERAEKVDYFNDKADCNNFLHMEDVVKDEFMEPILRFRSRIQRKHNTVVHMYMIHGMGNDIRNKTNDPNIDMIVGYGAGTPASYSCDPWRKDLFCYSMIQAGVNACQGKAGGMLSGWARNNMNQLFRKHYPDPRVQSMQIEIVRDLRNDATISQLTAEYLAGAMSDMLNYSSWSKPSSFVIKAY
jgi:hypothetical protein